MIYLNPIDKNNPRVAGFILFLERRGVTKRGISNIISFAGHRRVTVYLSEVAPALSSVFETDDISLLEYVYRRVCADENTIRLNRIYSGAVNRYIEYLSGKRIGRKSSICND